MVQGLSIAALTVKRHQSKWILILAEPCADRASYSDARNGPRPPFRNKCICKPQSDGVQSRNHWVDFAQKRHLTYYVHDTLDVLLALKDLYTVKWRASIIHTSLPNWLELLEFPVIESACAALGKGAMKSVIFGPGLVKALLNI